MYEVAVVAANKEDAATYGLEFKTLTTEARAIADKLLASSAAQEDGAVNANPGGNLEREAQAGGAG